ncbi:MAG: ferrous iron transport protein B [Euryarchaeota archaeon]|nr:ferrous iron transport protein B [Euryarchaeota archaeon]MBV1729161.1 ferrous iron transport protein B [Methanobacterium sp.]MBU4547310.1 ferrous iron transport protein B [Euryarchaeota archaeon]MBU4607500.1 ferrous iron transport protein B [Euryarchaeota archaeon]MBV1754721.1 ferrous iron transport protein B [Methanobacterium sp.]
MGNKTIKSWFRGFKSDSNDSKNHNLQENSGKTKSKLKKLVLVGNPNVGKSLLFNKLTGSYVMVSNYPGTTVSIDSGKCNISGEDYEIIDSPGMYSLSSITEEEQISKLILLEDQPDILLHVVDAKNMERMLPLTLQLIESKLPVVLVLNMIDEAENAGIKIDSSQLEEKLNIPVVSTAATTGQGIAQLNQKIAEYQIKDGLNVKYDEKIESAVQKISDLLKGEYPVSLRSLSLLLLQEDSDVQNLVKEKEGSNYSFIDNLLNETLSQFKQPLNYLIKMKLQKEATGLVSDVSDDTGEIKVGFREKLSRVMINPLTGIPILLAVLYFGLYQFVGVFAAGDMVDFIETNIFGEWALPLVEGFVTSTIPFEALQSLIIGDYGIFTLGITYGIAIILPIVGAFFLVFSILEDSGYLPRLSLLLDRLFQKIGLSGRAIIPMVLGVGCGSMATMTTRTLETKRERNIATLLLALTIPCSAQLGVIFAVLATSSSALWLWVIVILLNYIIIGFAASKILPGPNPTFYMELPPLRFPKLSNVLRKTYTRLIWYFKELLPLFIAISVLLWGLELTGILDFIIGVINPIVSAMGLPVETAQTFILGFFRRDYGAAGLFEIQDALTGVQLLVAAVVLTLFIPCVAQFMVMIKERGKKIALAMGVFILVYAFLVGFLLNLILSTLGVVL